MSRSISKIVAKDIAKKAAKKAARKTTTSTLLLPELRCFAALYLALAGPSLAVHAETTRVRYAEGTQHGYLALTTEDGKRIGTGELVQVARGDVVRVRLAYRFYDGSIDDESTVFTQRGTFRLISDHHVQKGPSFPHPYDVSIDMRTKQVVTRDLRRDSSGAKVDTKIMDLPGDLSNGVVLSVLKNLDPDTTGTHVTYLASMPQPRVVHAEIIASGDDSFRVGRLHYKARRLTVKISLGGLTGMVAPLIGKQPGDIIVWIQEGEAPAFIRQEGAFYDGGPVWISQMTSPTWESSPDRSHPSKSK